MGAISYADFVALAESVAEFPELTPDDQLAIAASSGNAYQSIGPDPPAEVQLKIEKRIAALRELYRRGIFQSRDNAGPQKYNIDIANTNRNHRRRFKTLAF